MSSTDYTQNLHRCFRCGYCKFTSDFSYYNCPMYLKYRIDSCMPGGILWLTRAMINGEIEITPEISEIIFSCTMCGNCFDKCPYEFHEEITEMIMSARSFLIEKNMVPKNVRNFFMNTINKGSPWGNYKGLEKLMEKCEGCKESDNLLLYAGDMVNYNEYSLNSVSKLVDIMLQAKISFGILREVETLDGNEIYMLGEKELFEYIAESNRATFEKYRIKKICTFSPHTYHAFKNYYSKEKEGVQVFHYTQLLWNWIQEGLIQMTGHGQKVVSYHDPCFLGRWNKEYDSARYILQKIPEIKYVELDRNRSDSLCCGGGGGNFYTDMLGGGAGHSSRIRIREAYEKGVDILTVACPTCAAMLQDAITDEKLQGKIEVLDIIDLVHGVMDRQKKPEADTKIKEGVFNN